MITSVCLDIVYDVPRSHSDTPQSLWLLWTGDQAVAETSNWKHSQQTDAMPSAVFEFTIPAIERQQTHALDGATTRNGLIKYYVSLFAWKNWTKSCNISCQKIGFPFIFEIWQQFLKDSKVAWLILKVSKQIRYVRLS